MQIAMSENPGTGPNPRTNPGSSQQANNAAESQASNDENRDKAERRIIEHAQQAKPA